jgi:hypothetical protein
MSDFGGIIQGIHPTVPKSEVKSEVVPCPQVMMIVIAGVIRPPSQPTDSK